MCLPPPHFTPAISVFSLPCSTQHPAPIFECTLPTPCNQHPAIIYPCTPHLASIFFTRMHVASCVHHQIECKKFCWKGFFQPLSTKKVLFQSDFCVQSYKKNVSQHKILKVWYLLPRPSSWYTEKKAARELWRDAADIVP